MAHEGHRLFGTQYSRVMPARFLLIGFLLAFAPLHGQQFLRITCDSTCLPAFSAIPDDVVVTCEEEFPGFEIPAATACPESPVANTPHVELDATSVTAHDAETALGEGVDWALWLGGFQAMGHGASDYFHPFGGGMTFEQYANGTARLHGEIVNDTDPDQRFEVDLFLEAQSDYDQWTALGRLPKDDLGLGAYVDWSYYEMVDTLSRLIGRGDFEGDMLYLDHMPFSKLFGFQVGENGANNRNTNHGISGWFWYRGIIAGQDVTGTGDVNADLTNPTETGSTCPIVETLHRVAMAWSDCGHHVYEQTLERIDEEAPMFIDLPPLESASCTDLPDTADISAFAVFDACGSALTLSNVDSVAGEPCNQVAYRTWTLTDACGNSTDTMQSVALVDTTGPTFFLEDTTIVCDAWDNYEPFVPEFEDDCSPADSVTWSFADTVTSGFYPFYFTLDRVYTATDLCGNETEQTMTISVIDTVAPTWIFLPPDTTILCDNWEDYTIVQPIVEDNCDPNPEGPGGGGATDTTITEGDCFGEFFVELTFEFADMSGNTITYVQVISAVDTVPPTFPFVPGDTTIACSEDWPQPEDGAEWMATAEDNFCPFDVVWNDSIVPGNCLGTDTLFRVFTAIDDCGNTTDSLQVITRIDTLGPEWTTIPMDTAIACGADLPELDLGALDNCGTVDSTWLTVDTLDIAFGDPVSTGFESCNLGGFVATGGSISISNDAYDGSCALSMVHAAGEPAHNFYPEDIMAGRGTYTVMARADGFISDNMIKLLAGDDEDDAALEIALRPLGTDNPGIEVMGYGVDVATDAAMQQGEWYQVKVVLAEAELTLFIDSVSVLVVDLPDGLPEQGRFKLAAAYAGSYDDMAYMPENPCPVVERYAQTIHALDDCGNLSTAVQIVDVIDTVAPFFTLPEDTALVCDNWDEYEAFEPEVIDDCTGMEGTSWSYVDVIDSGTYPVDFIMSRIYTGSDACGNSRMDTMVITVVDTTPPTLFTLFPIDTVISCETWDAEYPPLPPPSCEDNCDTTDCIGGDPVFDTVPGDCPGNFTILVTYEFSDGSGNTVTYAQTIMAVDTTPPTWTYFPPDTTLDCSEPFPAVTDSSIWAPIVTDNFCPDGFSCADSIVAGPCLGVDTLFRVCTAIDSCGNDTMRTQTIVRIDTVAPVIDESSIPEPVTIQCMEMLPLDVPTATDACSPVTLTETADTTDGDGLCFGGVVVTRTFTFSDDCGNESMATQLVTIVDTLAPEFDEASLPVGETLYCEETMPTCADFDVLAFDTCCETEVTCEETTDPTECPGTFTLHLNYTATDENGNAAFHTTTYDVVDTIGPVLFDPLPNDTIIDCDVSSVDDTPTLDSTAFTVVDGCNPWSFSVETEIEGEDENPCSFTRYDTYLFTDCNGNVTEFVHVLAVQDTTGPEIGGLGELFLDCPQEIDDFDVNAPLSSWSGGPEVQDNCTNLNDIQAEYEDVVTVSVDATHFTMVRTWTFTDQCANATVIEQQIVVDEPELILPNAFSPAGASLGNDINDRYVIPNMAITETDEGAVPPCFWGGDEQTLYFQVFNRWGTRVYASEPGSYYQNDWDGRNDDGQPLVNGTYFVLLQTAYKQYGVYVDLRNDE